MGIGFVGRVHFYPDSGLGGGSSISKAMHSRFLNIFRVREVLVTPDLLVSLSNKVFRDNLSFQDARTFLDPHKNSPERLTLCIHTLRFLETPSNKYRRGNIESLLGYLKKTTAKWEVLTGIKEEREKFIEDLDFNYPILIDKNSPTGTIDADLGISKLTDVQNPANIDQIFAPKEVFLTEKFWNEDKGDKLFTDEEYKYTPIKISQHLRDLVKAFNGNYETACSIFMNKNHLNLGIADEIVQIAIKIAFDLNAKPVPKAKDPGDVESQINEIQRLATRAYIKKKPK